MNSYDLVWELKIVATGANQRVLKQNTGYVGKRWLMKTEYWWTQEMDTGEESKALLATLLKWSCLFFISVQFCLLLPSLQRQKNDYNETENLIK